MAFLIKKNDEKYTRTDEGVLDFTLLQGMQDRFCRANNLYLVCLSRKHGVLTKIYGSKEEIQYVHNLIGMSQHVELLNKMANSDIENVIEEECGLPYVKMCGVSISIENEKSAIWIVVGIIESKAKETGIELPDYIMTTTEERYYKSVEFLEGLSKQFFAVKMEEVIAQAAVQKSKESEEQMKLELRRNEVITSIVKKLESEESFTDIAVEILREVCEYMGLSTGCLMRENKDPQKVDMICEHVNGLVSSIMEQCQEIEKNKLPFFNGKPYMISVNSMMPDEFQKMFQKYGIYSGVFLPLEINGHATMYLIFCDKEKGRIWDANDIKFLNGVKRIIQSILIKRITKNSLASSYASLEAILENVGCGIYVEDPMSGAVLYMNQRFRNHFQKQMEKGKLEQFLHQEEQQTDPTMFREIFLEEADRWYDLHNTVIQWVDGRTVMLYTIYDVTEKKRYQQKIERQANNDFLTGLYNRMRCEQDLEKYIKEAKEFGGEGALLYIDLDDFKHINDGLGHQYGDILLKAISARIQKVIGIENNCYRMGGDEFIIIVSHHHQAMLQKIINEIISIFSKPWMLKDTDYYCTMSMGVVRFPADGDTVEDLIKKADIAMYEAKCSGKNRVEYYDENIESTAFKRLDLEKNMRNATGNDCDEFEVYFQPIVDVTKPECPCCGAEALIRWNSKELGFINPGEFIPLAEYLGLINPIGDYILREACRHCKYWNDMGHPNYKVNVNLSVVQLLQNDIVDKIRLAITDSGIMPANLTLEVTESLAISDMNKMKKVLAEIKSLGVRVALDDFGTGYSSLNHIREMPLDVIKIDRCFVIDIGKDEFSDSFVKMVSELAHTIGVMVCVEGVEDEEQLEALKNKKIHYIQGYYFGKPMKAEEFEAKYISDGNDFKKS